MNRYDCLREADSGNLGVRTSVAKILNFYKLQAYYHCTIESVTMKQWVLERVVVSEKQVWLASFHNGTLYGSDEW